MKFSVRPKKERLEQIRLWLQEEKDIAGYSFICNFNIISECFVERNLHCVTKGDSTLGFCVYQLFDGRSEILITVVKPNLRNTGIGRFLIESHIREMSNRGVKVVTLECQPRSSAVIWEKIGFAKIPDGVDPNYSPPLRMWLPTMQSASLSNQEGDLGLIELWNCPPWDVKEGAAATWSWGLFSHSSKERPIVFPTNRDWKIRWIKQGSIQYEGKFKHFCKQSKYADFLILDGEPILK